MCPYDIPVTTKRCEWLTRTCRVHLIPTLQSRVHTGHCQPWTRRPVHTPTHIHACRTRALLSESHATKEFPIHGFTNCIHYASCSYTEQNMPFSHRTEHELHILNRTYHSHTRLHTCLPCIRDLCRCIVPVLAYLLLFYTVDGYTATAPIAVITTGTPIPTDDSDNAIFVDGNTAPAPVAVITGTPIPTDDHDNAIPAGGDTATARPSSLTTVTTPSLSMVILPLMIGFECSQTRQLQSLPSHPTSILPMSAVRTLSSAHFVVPESACSSTSLRWNGRTA